MKACIQRWGNSLAIGIPHAYGVDLHLEENMTVEITLADGRLVITPVRTPR